MARNLGSSWTEAAAQCGVSVGELRGWFLEHIKGGPDRWSKWDSGAEKIPKDYLIAFLRFRLDGKIAEVRARKPG